MSDAAPMPSEALGLYVHIPYCAAICPYCDFNVHRSAAPPWQSLLQAMVAELRYHRHHTFADQQPLSSIYFGGGTPSLAPPAFVADLIAAARQAFGVAAGAEITLEANPPDVNPALCAAWLQAGVNRLSLGWQSTKAHVLRVLGRRQRPNGGPAAYAAERPEGVSNISVDLIVAVPGQTMADLQADLQALVAARPEHVSLYELTYHAGTPLHRRRAQGRLTPASEGLQLSMMATVHRELAAAGYDHYEISSYARDGHQARHNSLYWQGGQYLGVGPWAHSFWRHAWHHGRRWEGLRDPAAYICAWRDINVHATPPATAFCEALQPQALFAERMMCALRQPRGINLQEPICAAHLDRAQAAAGEACRRGWAALAGSWLRPTPAGLQHADSLAALFF